mmetsp:Transcript_7857/g.19499  ORF Transcript_7857/g.19499 Transcript_7857/m.19499 type:complete len:256 (-) Transcript_7857:301-1068(-)
MIKQFLHSKLSFHSPTINIKERCISAHSRTEKLNDVIDPPPSHQTERPPLPKHLTSLDPARIDQSRPPRQIHVRQSQRYRHVPRRARPCTLPAASARHRERPSMGIQRHRGTALRHHSRGIDASRSDGNAIHQRWRRTSPPCHHRIPLPGEEDLELDVLAVHPLETILVALLEDVRTDLPPGDASRVGIRFLVRHVGVGIGVGTRPHGAERDGCRFLRGRVAQVGRRAHPVGTLPPRQQLGAEGYVDGHFAHFVG